MSKKNRFYPEPEDENTDYKFMEQKTEPKENLIYNEEDNSFELDVDSNDKEYDHPDPYDTSVKNGGDADSDYDMDNPTAVNEYDKTLSFESEVEKLAMHIDQGAIVQIDPIDKELSQTPEDKRDDLDEEGYPKNDQENFR